MPPRSAPPARSSTICKRRRKHPSPTSIDSRPYSADECLAIDPAARRSLEITETVRDGRREGSLLGSIDRTITSLGARLLADWLAAPLTGVATINARLDAVAELVADAALTNSLRESLHQIYDLQRLLARVATGRASPRDLAFIGRTLACLPKVKAKLTARTSACYKQLESRLDLCADIRGPLEQALVDDCPLATRDGNFIRPGYHADLDEFRDADGRRQTVDGRVPGCRMHADWHPEHQSRLQSRLRLLPRRSRSHIAKKFRLTTSASKRSKTPSGTSRPSSRSTKKKSSPPKSGPQSLKCEFFTQLRDLVAAAAGRLQATAAALAEIDVLAGARRARPLTQLLPSHRRRRTHPRHRSRPPPRPRHHGAGRDVRTE